MPSYFVAFQRKTLISEGLPLVSTAKKLWSRQPLHLFPLLNSKQLLAHLKDTSNLYIKSVSLLLHITSKYLSLAFKLKVQNDRDAQSVDKIFTERQG